MSHKIKILSLKLVISFSFILIFSGIFLLIEEQKYYVHLPPDEVTVVVEDPNSENDDIAITTTEEAPPPDNPQDAPSEENNTANSNSTITNQNTGQTQQTPTDPLVETNNQLRNSIEDKYGINIKYGSEIGSYNVTNLTITHQTDPSTINTALNTLNQELSLYPNGFIKETTDIGLNLNLYIIKRYSQDYVTGITDSRNANIIISLATDYSIKDTIHHEIFHYIENYLLNVGGTFDTWDNQNPGDFVYNHLNSSYTCNINNPIEAKFINNYAQTNAYEDRASTFEFMMKDYKSTCFIKNNTIDIKATFIANQLDQFFQSVNSYTTEHWERFL